MRANKLACKLFEMLQLNLKYCERFRNLANVFE